VLVLYKDFCVILAPKPRNKIPKISDSKIITFYTNTNTTPPLADFAKKLLPLRRFIKKITAMREINPQETTRAYAFEMWMQAPNPMVTFFKTLDVSRLLKISRKSGLKFNMLMCYCIGRAASQVKEFYLLPVGDKLMQYDTIAVNTIVANSAGEVSSCDLHFNEDLEQFNSDYLRLTKQVAESCTDHDLSAGSMVIGSSALAQYEIDGAVGMYSGIFNNPFMIWGRYKRGLFKTTLSVSFQFHHTQMDGAHAAKFLDLLQREIEGLKV